MRCAYVVWVDSVHMEAWNHADNLKNVKYEVTCGILVRDEPEFVTLALSYAEETKEYGHVIAIPRVAIKSIRIFAGGAQKKPRAKRAARPARGDEQGNQIDPQGTGVT